MKISNISFNFPMRNLNKINNLSDKSVNFKGHGSYSHLEGGVEYPYTPPYVDPFESEHIEAEIRDIKGYSERERIEEEYKKKTLARLTQERDDLLQQVEDLKRELEALRAENTKLKVQNKRLQQEVNSPAYQEFMKKYAEEKRQKKEDERIQRHKRQLEERGIYGYD